MKKNKPLIQIKNLSQHFKLGKQVLKAVNDVSFTIYEGETLGLVGESGCGKSTIAKSMIRLLEPTTGQIIFDGIDIAQLKRKEMIKMRENMQIIFQDTFASLNPRMTVEEIIHEPLHIHRPNLSSKEKQKRVLTLLEQVGLPHYFSGCFPHQLSGGQRQRVCIAKALALHPKFIICDESIAALDVSIQSQIVILLKKLQREHKLTYLFISHDISMVKYLCDRIAVMYLGKIVESAPAEELCKNPMHPYTQALLSAVPIPDPCSKKNAMQLTETEEKPQVRGHGCEFHNRCSKASPLCRRKIPCKLNISQDHYVSCFECEKIAESALKN